MSGCFIERLLSRLAGLSWVEAAGGDEVVLEGERGGGGRGGGGEEPGAMVDGGRERGGRAVEREEVPAEEQHGGAGGGGGCASIPPDSAASPVEMERFQSVRVRGNWAREARSQPFSLGFFSRGKRRSFFPAAIRFFFLFFTFPAYLIS